MWMPIIVITLITLALVLKGVVFLRKKEEKHGAQDIDIFKVQSTIIILVFPNTNQTRQIDEQIQIELHLVHENSNFVFRFKLV